MLDPAFLRPSRFVESDAPPIVDFARSCISNVETPIDMGVRLYYAVRDSVLYDPLSFSKIISAHSGGAVRKGLAC
jgi:transglutaminase-like putative cysteine protease